MKKHKPMSRSENMARVKSKNTKPEIFLRKLLWHKGFRYRINYEGLPGRPDVYFPKYKTAIFVNGCFWHLHENCKYSSIPKNNHEFWKSKLEGNAERDKKNYAQLESMGIKTIVVWGCTIKRMMKNTVFSEEYIGNILSEITNKI
ncbi:MAG: very short patch repair endonuclease [Negativicoccus succinicivorans]|uniref:very short patch repair endonuclease n=1 Tax=Negativicoccus succinicivorans TaxID=620903 RepID=UPI002912194F|nr:very short patch repair endonuclease [Negativicoccus succinicivorans]MDU5371911.1 very short patch repair endonuclease [Negativicoccus succinicivorans]MDU5399676.1 very short patch repair endonuclease [Negativicoccus succinicivorans]